ncbi:unnamed protein product [Cladocopium goreaui]|uniref:DUF268 domain-containing protein n=1 Tax=Cladocopium goreaui TaxID=2562237 RepID=A0A9P1D9F0_9DINO|nr:unnamed protein product [Cladocopium goreaui]
MAFAWLLLGHCAATFFPRVPFEKSHLHPESYWVDTPSGPTQLCYHKGDISFQLCCDERFGDRGNEDCWDSFDTYERCCSPGQWDLLTTLQWPADKIFHNAHLAVQVDKDPRWFNFPFRATSLCPDTTGPESQNRSKEIMEGMPELEFDGVAEEIHLNLAGEPSNLWTLVREACSISILLALTAYSAALQTRVALMGSYDATDRIAEIWPRFQQILRQILGQMQEAKALVDATGFPLLPPMEVIQIWQEMIFSMPSKSLQDLAEEILEHAQGAYYATEDFYFSRLRPRLLEGCGAVCDISLQTEGSPTFWVPEYLADVDCPAITGNRVAGQSARLQPPLRSVPYVFKDDFQRGGVTFLPRYELATVHSWERRCKQWSKDSVEDLMNLFRFYQGPEPLRWPRFDDFVAYDSEELNSTARFVASLRDALPLLEDAMGGHWLVLGSLSPWIEAILLEYGVASRVSTLEYANLSSCPDRHPKITNLLPEDFNQGYLSAERFDGFVQWSSVEHSGLGMYGDEINPWGDRQAVAQLWCRGRAKAWFFFGPGPEGPGGSVMGRKLHNENRSGRHSGSPFDEPLYWNAGRDYGREALGRLMLNWKLVRPANGTWNFHIFQRLENTKEEITLQHSALQTNCHEAD